MIPEFKNILGQSHAVGMLSEAIASDRLTHAMIFAGPVGVGKGTTAEALAAVFLCEKPRGSEPCGACPSCGAFEAGMKLRAERTPAVIEPIQVETKKTDEEKERFDAVADDIAHPDYHRVYRTLIRLEKSESKARDLSIDVIRDFVLNPAGLKSVQGRGKFFVIEEADRMSEDAQNALLKTLEEPHGRTAIVLLTSRPDKLLQTVRSRCQTIRFGTLEIDLIRDYLARHGVDARTAGRAALLADGSLGLAIRWIEDGVVEASIELLARLTNHRFEGLDLWLKEAAAAYSLRQVRRDKLVSTDQANREGLNIYFRIAAEHFRKELAEQSDPELLERTCNAIDAIARAETYLGANVTVSLVLQQLAMAFDRGAAV